MWRRKNSEASLFGTKCDQVSIGGFVILKTVFRMSNPPWYINALYHSTQNIDVHDIEGQLYI